MIRNILLSTIVISSLGLSSSAMEIETGKTYQITNQNLKWDGKKITILKTGKEIHNYEDFSDVLSAKDRIITPALLIYFAFCLKSQYTNNNKIDESIIAKLCNKQDVSHAIKEKYRGKFFYGKIIDETGEKIFVHPSWLSTLRST